jgi:hypothetical protein
MLLSPCYEPLEGVPDQPWITPMFKHGNLHFFEIDYGDLPIGLFRAHDYQESLKKLCILLNSSYQENGWAASTFRMKVDDDGQRPENFVVFMIACGASDRKTSIYPSPEKKLQLSW